MCLVIYKIRIRLDGGFHSLEVRTFLQFHIHHTAMDTGSHAKCVDTMEEIYEKCDFIGKFKDMTDADMKMPFKKGQIIMTALDVYKRQSNHKEEQNERSRDRCFQRKEHGGCPAANG